jgi:hypothetical protein
MTSRKLSAFIDAIATGRRPKRFRADAEDVEVLRGAVELRAARPGDAEPTAAFTDGLFLRLSEQAKQQQERTQIRTASRPRAAYGLAGRRGGCGAGGRNGRGHQGPDQPGADA